MVGVNDQPSAAKEFGMFLNRAYIAYCKACTDVGQPVPNWYDFANFLDIPASTISNWIAGSRPPSEENLAKLSFWPWRCWPAFCWESDRGDLARWWERDVRLISIRNLKGL